MFDCSALVQEGGQLRQIKFVYIIVVLFCFVRLSFPRLCNVRTRVARMSAKKKARIESDPGRTSAGGGKDAGAETAVLRSDATFPTAKDFDAAAPYPHGHVDNLLDSTFYDKLRTEVRV